MSPRVATGALVAATLLVAGACTPAEVVAPQRPEQTATSAPTAPRPGTVAAAPSRSPRWRGVVLPGKSVDLRAQLGGRLEALHAEVGEPVEEGQLIASLQLGLMRFDLARQEASVAGAQAALKRALAEQREAADRQARRSGTPELFSREELRRAQRDLEIADAGLELAQARADEATAILMRLEAERDGAQLRAPFAGTITSHHLDAGATVDRGTPVVRLSTTSQLIVRFAVPPPEVELLAAGSAVAVHLPSGPVVDAEVHHVAPEVDLPSGTLFVQARLLAAAQPGPLSPGSPVWVTPAAVASQGVALAATGDPAGDRGAP